eukprot:620220-Pyramimonas_sp.AAC.1
MSWVAPRTPPSRSSWRAWALAQSSASGGKDKIPFVFLGDFRSKQRGISGPGSLWAARRGLTSSSDCRRRTVPLGAWEVCGSSPLPGSSSGVS